MSKVGSTSVYSSLKNRLKYIPVIHVHFLGEFWLEKFRHGHSVFNINLEKAKQTFKVINKSKTRIKIITLVREPISRDVSGIFQTWKHLFDFDNINDIPVSDIVTHLNSSKFNYCEEWFKTDFLEFTGMNILNEKFDIERGYSIYKNEKVDVLCIKLEKLNEVYLKAFKDFLDIDNFILENQNISTEKKSSGLNRQVKSNFRLSDEKLTEIYDTKYMKTFYSSQEIEAFKREWQE
jgi:hypothetical protein